jgi:hypothetical protein
VLLGRVHNYAVFVYRFYGMQAGGLVQRRD